MAASGLPVLPCTLATIQVAHARCPAAHQRKALAASGRGQRGEKMGEVARGKTVMRYQRLDVRTFCPPRRIPVIEGQVVPLQESSNVRFNSRWFVRARRRRGG